MCSVPIHPRAATRAQWLAELSDALDEAQQLLRMLELTSDQHALACETFLRIEAARMEVQSLRLSRGLNPRRAWHEFERRADRPPGHSPCGASPPPANGSR